MSFCNFSIRRLLLAKFLLALLALRNAFSALFAFLALAEAELASLKASVRLVASSLALGGLAVGRIRVFPFGLQQVLSRSGMPNQGIYQHRSC